MKITILNTQDISTVIPFIHQLKIPDSRSHKGQNGKLLVIGGSSLFHSASIWAAEIASHFVDMVHYCSTKENTEVMLSLKKKFQNGMVIRQEDLSFYMKEDDVILMGPGMMRGELKTIINNLQFADLLLLQKNSEADFTHYLTQYLLLNFPAKKFVLDAGAVQMMDKQWLMGLNTKPIVTPHIKEFIRLIGETIPDPTIENCMPYVVKFAKQYNCILIVKLIDDIVTDGENIYVIKGGNAGLTKGGTGDILAGLVASFYAQSDAMVSAVIASFLLKSTADKLYEKKGTWYNNDDIIKMLPCVLNKIRKQAELTN